MPTTFKQPQLCKHSTTSLGPALAPKVFASFSDYQVTCGKRHIKPSDELPSSIEAIDSQGPEAMENTLPRKSSIKI